ncbi:MAG: phosphoglycerate dehydrogenase [Deltaproteobacteria bacterium HGW-Deltaproteobacteria-17]|nr:MAG: phosphoglycerate dehydrogenase [Deltaproteobacteria bacterium HGW-Deltaproteobacteria-17]
MTTSYPLHKIKVVLLENIHGAAARALEAEGYTVETHARALSGSELLDAAGDAHLIGIRSKTRLDAGFFERATRLWAVGCFCIGTNQVALAEAAARGVAVFNAPFSNTRSVAELTIAEIIALHRGIFLRCARMHLGRWSKSASGAHEVRGRTLGIVGYGRIGSQVSILAEALGMRVLFFDTARCLPLGNAQAVDALDDLLARCDVVSLHVPSTAATRRMIGAAQLGRMRKGAYFINNARGDVVDLDALAGALRSGHLAGAAVDVFPEEPESNDDPFACALLGLDSVILTPHIAGSTEEAQNNIAEEVSTKLIRFMNNGSTSAAVNVPQVDLPVLHAGRRRILHYHRNVPGVLSKIHRVIADRGNNISAEYLQSDPKHSYVIIDVDSSQGEALKEELGEIPETIRVRTLW